jgi:hypothetical protein
VLLLLLLPLLLLLLLLLFIVLPSQIELGGPHTKLGVKLPAIQHWIFCILNISSDPGTQRPPGRCKLGTKGETETD